MADAEWAEPNGTRSISEEEWEEAKSTIEELYMEQGKQLSDVIRIMATEYDFVANERQYKYRLAQWGFEKYITNAKMQAISCIRSKRLLQGKETVFSNYGQPINPEKIDRWEQRHDNPSADGIQSSPPTPPGVTYITPTSSPTSNSPPRDRILNPQAPSFSPEPATATPGYGQAPPQQNFSYQQAVPANAGYGYGYGYGHGCGYLYSQPPVQSFPRPPMPPINSNTYYDSNHQIPPPPPQGPQQFGNGAPSSYAFQYSQCTGQRKALLIGINYFGQRGQLRGCINDVRNMSSYLVENFRYKREDMVILTDDQQNPMSQPTKQNILRAMHWLVKDARPNDSLFFHYSGHGDQTKDLDGDEEDGFDEVIYPVDFRQVGHITDDEMHRIIVRPLQGGVRLTCIFDSCHSGAALDLPYIYSTQGILKEPNLAKEAGQTLLGVITAYERGDQAAIVDFFKKATAGEEARSRQILETKTSPADVIMLSGSKDDQTSADCSIASQATGAMSWAFITALKKKRQQSYLELLNNIRDELQTRYTQKPQLSCSHPLNTNLLFIM